MDCHVCQGDRLMDTYQAFLKNELETLKDTHPELPAKERLNMARAKPKAQNRSESISVPWVFFLWNSVICISDLIFWVQQLSYLILSFYLVSLLTAAGGERILLDWIASRAWPKVSCQGGESRFMSRSQSSQMMMTRDAWAHGAMTFPNRTAWANEQLIHFQIDKTIA